MLYIARQRISELGRHVHYGPVANVMDILKEHGYIKSWRYDRKDVVITRESNAEYTNKIAFGVAYRYMIERLEFKIDWIPTIMANPEKYKEY